MAVGYHFTVKVSTVFKSYFTAMRVACATLVKRLKRFLERHWVEAGRKLPHVRMSLNPTVVRRTRPRAIQLAMAIIKKPACLLVWVWGVPLLPLILKIVGSVKRVKARLRGLVVEPLDLWAEASSFKCSFLSLDGSLSLVISSTICNS